VLISVFQFNIIIVRADKTACIRMLVCFLAVKVIKFQQWYLKRHPKVITTEKTESLDHVKIAIEILGFFSKCPVDFFTVTLL